MFNYYLSDYIFVQLMNCLIDLCSTGFWLSCCSKHVVELHLVNWHGRLLFIAKKSGGWGRFRTTYRSAMPAHSSLGLRRNGRGGEEGRGGEGEMNWSNTTFWFPGRYERLIMVQVISWEAPRSLGFASQLPGIKIPTPWNCISGFYMQSVPSH